MHRHTLLAKGGWLWFVIPSLVVIVAADAIATNAQGPAGADTSTSTALFLLSGLVTLALPVEILLRYFFLRSVRQAVRRQLAPAGHPAFSSSGYAQAQVRHHTRPIVAPLIVFLGLLAGGGYFIHSGVQKQILLHSSSTQHVQATVDSVSQYCGRGCKYTTYASFDDLGRAYTHVTVSDDRPRRQGEVFELLVDPKDGTDNAIPGDHGLAYLIGGSIVVVVDLIGYGVNLAGHRRRRRDLAAAGAL